MKEEFLSGKENQVHFGQIITAFRTKKNLTTKELAKLFYQSGYDMNEKLLDDIETGASLPESKIIPYFTSILALSDEHAESFLDAYLASIKIHALETYFLAKENMKATDHS